MFLCDNCHDAKKHIDLFRSRGRCEVCGKTAAFIDCHYTTCDPPRRKPKPPPDASYGRWEK